MRVTTTFPYLLYVVDYSIVYAVGEEKKEALKRVLQDKGTLEETPARVIRDMKNVYLFTDQDI